LENLQQEPIFDGKTHVKTMFFWGEMWFAAMINLAFGDGLYKASNMVNWGFL